MSNNNLKKQILEASRLMSRLSKSRYINAVTLAADTIVSSLKNGKKIMIAGNGGSAADADHFAAELSGQFIKKNRPPQKAVSLNSNSSALTAIGNDFGYGQVFSRQLTGLGVSGDVFIGFSTSGNSKNIINALAVSKRLGIKTICFLGKDGGEAKNYCDLSLIAPSGSTPRIQEAHTMLMHLICSIVDESF